MKTVLAVDDELPLLDMIEQQLGSLGYDAITASVAENAFRLVKERPIDLVLLDVRMPRQSGFSMYRQFVARQSLPVLFMTGDPSAFAFDSPELGPLWKEQFIAGTTDILYKPFSSALLQEKLEALIGGESAEGLNDRECNRSVRQVLVRQGIDLGNISFRTQDGVVLLSGEIKRIKKFGTDLDHESVAGILDELRKCPQVRELRLNLSNFAASIPAPLANGANASGKADSADKVVSEKKNRPFSLFGWLRGRRSPSGEN